MQRPGQEGARQRIASVRSPARPAGLNRHRDTLQHTSAPVATNQVRGRPSSHLFAFISYQNRNYRALNEVKQALLTLFVFANGRWAGCVVRRQAAQPEPSPAERIREKVGRKGAARHTPSASRG